MILASLPDGFAQFVLDYWMNNIMSTIPDLINLLKIADEKIAEKKEKETALKETCFYCGQVGHWKRNCKTYLESRKEVACHVPSTLGIYVIQVYTVSPDNIWEYDTNCGSYIWINMQGLRNNSSVATPKPDPT